MSGTRHAGEGAPDRGGHSEDNPAIEREMSRDVFNLPQNVVMNGIRDYPADIQDELLWLVGYTRSVLHGSRDEICRKLKVDYSTLFRILTGKYGAKLDRFLATLKHLREKASQPGATFIETIVTKKIFQRLDRVRDYNVLGHICASSGRGKTASVTEWQRRNNHGRSIYIDCPTIGGIRSLLVEIAIKAGIHTQRSTVDLAERISKSFDWRQTIIVDESARLLPQMRSIDVAGLEFLRRLHDVSGCGIVIVSTQRFQQAMEGGKIHAYMEQVFRRIEDPLFVPDYVSHTEAAEICCHFNPDADVDLIEMAHSIANDKGRLGILFSMLNNGMLLARSKKEPLNAGHLAAAKKFRENENIWPND